ncbi:putative acyl-CoA-binding protein [Lucilia cuprina]|uniref:Putative acyl-CoA-binding protein n=1 Tax=Lucilia cuprina TaxID=7375 RepID=A0A0L0CCA2_LUCCU|nr:acyl-CoA-binding protein homolog [Lucilia cuprina]XP_037810457.1 acyl-CoA-binding protein homolog [Lucilia sericata]KAI8126011.1 Acyl-CoA-binding protein like protein [Lucilia cuprina]KNC29865.1 putative acyl-CoA-binding protein [Lucilia cuprina]
MSLDEQFNAAAERVKTLTKRPTDEEFLELYALFKQATVGDNNTSKPGLLDLKGKAKWESWNKQKGKSQEDAKKEYVAFVEKLVAQYA